MKLQTKILFIVLLFLASCSKAANNNDNPKYQEVVAQYGANPRNTIYVINTKLIKAPTILFVHGGGWNSSGYKEWVTWSKTAFFMNNGINLAAINYRLSPKPVELKNPDRTKHPDHIRDVAMALRWLVDNADASNIDITQIFIMGHSAGAQIACLLATNTKYLDEVKLPHNIIKGVISLDGGYYLTGNVEAMKKNNDIWNAYENAFTDNKEVLDDANPYLHIKPKQNIPPFLIVTEGKKIPERFIPNSQMHDKLRENGYQSTLFLAQGYEHSEIFNNIGTNKDTLNVGKEIVTFIRKTINK